ncbi:hypothetical protein Celaphus_00001616, partial [Cervus elaphus hippelaphus]
MPGAFMSSSDMLLGLSQPILPSGWHTQPVPRSQLPGQLTHWHRPWAHRLLLIHSPEGDRISPVGGNKDDRASPCLGGYRAPGCCPRLGALPFFMYGQRARALQSGTRRG